MKLAFIIFSCLIAIIFGYFYFSSRYQSAFEADQQCHYEMNIESLEGSLLGCDHDIETKQWLLYKEGEKKMPSTVLKRFRY